MITTFIDCIYYAKGWYEFEEDGRGQYWRGFAKCAAKDLGWEPKTKHEVADILLSHIQNHLEDYKAEYGNIDDVYYFYKELKRRMFIYDFTDTDDAVISLCRGIMQMLSEERWDHKEPDYVNFKHKLNDVQK